MINRNSDICVKMICKNLDRQVNMNLVMNVYVMSMKMLLFISHIIQLCFPMSSIFFMLALYRCRPGPQHAGRGR